VFAWQEEADRIKKEENEAAGRKPQKEQERKTMMERKP
jgi:hypothetical protein